MSAVSREGHSLYPLAFYITFERGPLFDDKRRVDESSIGSKVARVVDHSCNSLTRVVRTKLLLHLAPPTLSRSLGVRRNYTP